MPANIVCTQIDEPEFIGNDPRHCYETWKATGGAALDTGALTTKLSKPDYILGGGLTLTSVSGQTVTVTSLVALGANATVFRLYGRAGTGML